MEGWVDLGSLIADRPGIKPTTAWSQVRRPNRYATKPSIEEKKCANYFSSPFIIIRKAESCDPQRFPGTERERWFASARSLSTVTSELALISIFY